MKIIPNAKVIGVKNPITVKNYYLEYAQNVNLPFSGEKQLFSQGLGL